MAQAGLDVSKLSPHSTRAAPVSAAYRASVNLDEILKKQLVGHQNVVLRNSTTSR